MTQFWNFMHKEFLHIFRDTRTMLILIAMPIIQLLIFGYAITTEIRNIPLSIWDKSKSAESKQIIDALTNNNYVKFASYLHSKEEIEKGFKRGKHKAVLIIPADLTEELHRGQAVKIQLLLDASEPNEASSIHSYVLGIISQSSNEKQLDQNSLTRIHTEVKMLYNPQLKSAYNFVPGLIGLVLMLICAMMTSIAIVREKEQGTMEVLLVSPIRAISIVIAKAIPYFVLAMINVISILLLSYFLFKVPIAGSLITILFLCILFTLAALSLGMFISSLVNTQQAAMIISSLGLMLPTIMLSGLVFPIESMPLLLRFISNILPAKWFIIAIKQCMIRGLGIVEIYKEILILGAMTFVFIFASIRRFKNRL